MTLILMTALCWGAAPTEDALLQRQEEGSWVYTDSDNSRFIHLTLLKEKSLFGHRRQVILQVTSSVRFPSRQSNLTRAWKGNYSVTPGDEQTEIR